MWNSETLLVKKRFEYRIETIQLLHKQVDEQTLVACLNEWGKEGWLVCQIDLAALHGLNGQGVSVLLVRSLVEPNYAALNVSNYDDDDSNDNEDNDFDD